MTHDELVRFAAIYLRKVKKLPVVLEDVRSMMTREQPDVIGWTNDGRSTLIEVKVSIEDFRRDADKWFRRRPEEGMGWLRYYAFPEGLTGEVKIPPGWGVIICNAKGKCRITKTAQAFPEYNRRDECALLVQGVRKVTEGWGRSTFGADAPQHPDGDPHPKAAAVIRDLRKENRGLRDRLREERRLLPAKVRERLPNPLFPTIVPGARVCLIGMKNRPNQREEGHVQCWGNSFTYAVHVKWDDGHESEVNAHYLHVLAPPVASDEACSNSSKTPESSTT